MITFQANAQLLSQISQDLQRGLNTFNEKVAQQARQQLYPGHGYRTGNLQRNTRAEMAFVAGNIIQGSIGSYGVEYGMYIHNRYRYIYIALEQLQSQAINIISGSP